MGGWLEIIAAIVGTLATLAAVWFGGKKAGRDARDADAAKRNLDNAVRAREIDNEVEGLSPDALRDRAREWVRKE